jgi:hypothetical protein
MDKVALGRQGEIFVMQKVMEKGWAFPKDYHENMNGLDWIFQKNGKVIKVQVKASLKNNIEFSISDRGPIDYLIITNLKVCYIIPKLLIGKTNRLTKTFKRLAEKYALLDLQGYNLVNELNDCKIRYGLMDRHELWNIAKNIQSKPVTLCKA